jgi:SRSO17 transposase
MAELRWHTAEMLAAFTAMLVVDHSGLHKRRIVPYGVTRRWCGPLGKVKNCQLGMFMASLMAGGYAPLD